MSRILDGVPPRNVRPETKLVVSLVSGSHFINHTYLVLLPPVFGLLVTEFDASLTELGIAVGVLSLFSTVFQLPFGYLSDTYGRTPTLGIGLALGALGVLTIAFAPTFEWLLTGQAVVGTGIAAHHPAHFPLLSDATVESVRGKAFSVHGFAGNMGYAASPAVTTTVLAVPGLTWRAAFVVMGAAGGVYAVVGVVVLSRWVSDDVTRPTGAESDAREYTIGSVRERVGDELRSLVSSPAILALATLSLVTAIVNWAIRSYAVVLLTDGYGVELNAANTILTVMFVAAATLILVGGELSDRWWAGGVILLSYTALVVAAAAVATLLLPPAAAMVAVVLAGGSLTLGGPAKSKLVDALSMRSDLGKNFAIITVGVSVGGAVAPPVFGAIIDAAGLRAAFGTVAGFGVLAIGIVLAILHTYREAGGAPFVPGDDD